MSEESIIRFCAPTLANLKSGGLFRSPYDSWEHYLAWEKEMNRKLNSSGVYVISLRRAKDWVLIYVYRESLLKKDLQAPGIREFLTGCGYPEGSLPELLSFLRLRIRDNPEFPHEIGLFLGYPLEDVEGFVKNGGRNFLYCDYWKVYRDPEKKKRRFSAFHNCSQVYEKLFAKGRTLQQLSVRIRAAEAV